MSLQLLFAGCSKDERALVEGVVREALGRRVQAAGWTVSVVRIPERWSITLDAPAAGVRSLAFVTPDQKLREALAEALGKSGLGVDRVGPLPAAGAVDARPEEQQARQKCASCGREFVVRYEAVPEEDEESVAVACPHCWQMNHALIGANAAQAREYRSDKA